MGLIVIAALGFGVLIAVLLFQTFHYRRISEFFQKGIDLAPVIREIDDVRQRQEQIDRSVREEISRGRQEQSGQSQLLRGEVVTVLTGIGDSVTTKLDSLTRSNDQKLELVRSAMEQRLDSFTTQSGSKLQELRATVDGRLATIQVENEKKLEQTSVAI